VLTIVHTAIALLATASGTYVVAGMLRGDAVSGRWPFLMLAALSTGTAFLFPIHDYTPALSLAIITAALIVVAWLARAAFRDNGRWRIASLLALPLILYAHVLALIIQAFKQVPPLHAMATNGGELAPRAAHLVAVLALAIVLAVLLNRHFRGVGALRAD
jgi:hypothetical protein